MEIKLSDYAKEMEAFGEDPLYIIQEYIKAKGKEIEALGMVVALAVNKSKKVEAQLNYARSWIPNKIDLARANKNVTADQAKLLDRLTDIYLLGMDIPSQYLDEVKATIPQMKMPQFIFVPMVEWLRDKYGIRFMEDGKTDERKNKIG